LSTREVVADSDTELSGVESEENAHLPGNRREEKLGEVKTTLKRKGMRWCC